MILLWNSADMKVYLTLIDGDMRQEHEWLAGRELARDMLGFVRDCLAEQQADFTNITGIGVFRGPGSYTGLRIGLTALNTLASALAVPIVGATGDGWQDECIGRLIGGENDAIVLPEYGGEAHITKQKK